MVKEKLDPIPMAMKQDNQIKVKFKLQQKKIFDFRSLTRRDRKVLSVEDMKAKKNEFKRSIEELRQYIQKTQPNMRALEQLKDTEKKMQDASKELEQAKTE